MKAGTLALAALLLLSPLYATALSCMSPPIKELVESHQNIYVIEFTGARLISPELKRVKGEYKILRVLRSEGIGGLPVVSYNLGQGFWPVRIPVGQQQFLFWNEEQEVIEWGVCSGHKYHECQEYEINALLNRPQKLKLSCELLNAARDAAWTVQRISREVDEFAGRVSVGGKPLIERAVVEDVIGLE